MNSVYDLSWNKDSFLAKLKLFSKSRQDVSEKIKSRDLYVRAEGYSALSSTYYSIVGTALSQLKANLQPVWSAPFKIAIWSLTWLPLALWCYIRMFSLSDRVMTTIGYVQMTADQCDVRQTILRRQGRYAEASTCIRRALAKENVRAHTRALLWIGLADVEACEGNRIDAIEALSHALQYGHEAENHNPRQAVRIYRNCANIADKVDAGDVFRTGQLRHRAEELARSVGALDQIIKL